MATVVLATIKLEDGVRVKEVDGNVREYTEVNIIRKLKVKDMKHIQLNKFTDLELSAAELVPLIVAISDTPAHVFDEMTMGDLTKVMDSASDFFT